MSSLAIWREISSDPRANGQVHGSLRKPLVLAGLLFVGVSCSKREPSADGARASAAKPAAATSAPLASQPRAAADEPVAAASEAVKASPPPPAPEPPEPPTARSETAATTVTDVFDDYGFPAYTGLEHLCGGRDILGDGEHVSWDVFTSSDAPERISEAYTRRLGSGGRESEAGGSTWRLPAGSPVPARTLRVAAPDRPGKHTSCKTKAPASAKSVVVLTRRS